MEQTGRRRPESDRGTADALTARLAHRSSIADADTSQANDPLTPRTRWENALGILILFEAAHVLYFWYPTAGLVADDRLTNLGRLIWPCLAAASAYAIMSRPWLERRSFEPLVLIPILLVSLSFIWSVDGIRSLYQSIVLSAVLICGAYLAIAYRKDELVVLVSNALGIVCAINVLAVLAGVDDGSSQTTGFFEHKNIFGPVAAVAFIFFLARVVMGERHRHVQLAMALSGIALFMSGSRTSQFATLVVLMATTFVAVRRQSQRAALAITAPMMAVFAAAFRAVGGTDAIFVASGKSADLTGRTDIWATVMSLIAKRPIQGWGFLAYWRDEGFADGTRSGFEEFGLRSAHNGYLETALGAGVLAGALVAVGLLALLVRGYRGWTSSSPRPSDVALATLALYCVIANFSEAIFPASTLVLFTLLIIALSAAPRRREYES